MKLSKTMKAAIEDLVDRLMSGEEIELDSENPEFTKHLCVTTVERYLIDDSETDNCEIKRLARIGKATETAFEETNIAMFVSYRKDEDRKEMYVDENNSFNFESIEELLGWAGMEDK